MSVEPGPMDASRHRPYMMHVVNRLLLTLIALITGFVAQVSPAQAHVQAGVNVEIGASARVGQMRGEAQVASLDLVRAKARGVPVAAARTVWLPLQLAPVTVLVRVDRARE